jgi:hypothetical protein
METRVFEWRKKEGNIQYVEIVTTVIERIVMEKPLAEFVADLDKKEQDIKDFDAKKHTEELQKGVDEMRLNIQTAKEV